MSTTPVLGIPLVEGQQASPEITHNEAVYLLALALRGCIQLGLNTPPGSPAEGDVYVLGAAPTGVWSGQANKIAIRVNGAWRFVPGVDSGGTNIPIGADQAGLSIFNQDDSLFYVWTGAAWSSSYDASGKVNRSGDTMTGALDIIGAGAIGLILAGDGFTALRVDRFSNNSLGGSITPRKGRGTRNAPINVNNGDTLGNFNFFGWADGGFVDSANIRAQVIEPTPSSTSLGSRMELLVTPIGAATSTEVLRLENATGLSMYGANPVITANRLIRTRVFTAATLPSAGIATGDTAIVSDANATTIGSVVAGGGANRVRVNYDGSNWRIG